MFCLRSSRTRKFLMSPSSLSSSAMRTFNRLEGMSHFSCSARLALRMRVRRSAMGSLRMLPARLHDARNLALEGELAEAQAAHLELPDIRARTPAQLTPMVGARLEPGGPLRLHDERGLGHNAMTPLTAYRDARAAPASTRR